MTARRLLLLFLLSVPGTSRLAAQQVLRVELVGDSVRREYRFRPARLDARPGDVLECVVKSGGPYLLVVSLVGSEEALARSPLLTGTGALWRFPLAGLGRGNFRVFALTHVSYRMALELRVGSGSPP